MSDTLISTREFRRRAGDRSAMWIHRHQLSDSAFPVPFQFAPNGPKFWRLDEVEHYLESCRAPRVNGCNQPAVA